MIMICYDYDDTVTIYPVSLPKKETHFSLPWAPPRHLPSDPSGSTMHRETPSGLSWMSQNHSNGMALGVFRCVFFPPATSQDLNILLLAGHISVINTSSTIF